MTTRFERYVAIGDSSTEGLEDPDGAGGYRGWANRLAERIAGIQGGLLYANLGVRGKRAREIREEQLGPALEMKPDLATIFAGSNDMIDRGFDPDALLADLVRMMRALIETGTVVLTFTLPDLTGVMPIGRLLSRRVKAMNDAIKAASAKTGARLVDFAAESVGSDPRLWTEDRFHVNAEGHARIAAALGQALALPGSDDTWRLPLPGIDGRSRLTRWSETWRWYRHHLFGRAWPGRASAELLRAKRPRMEPFPANTADAAL
ncbi:MAG: SGNH/GDSL hydrolase family protein [Planctomycetota bacterium]